MKCFYFGAWSSSNLGHYLYANNGAICWEGPPLKPSMLDAGLIPHNRRDAKTQDGKLYRSVVNGWTIVTCWDQSGDNRPGSNSAFVVEGEHTTEAAVAIGRAAFPIQASRKGFPLT